MKRTISFRGTWTSTKWSSDQLSTPQKMSRAGKQRKKLGRKTERDIWDLNGILIIPRRAHDMDHDSQWLEMQRFTTVPISARSVGCVWTDRSGTQGEGVGQWDEGRNKKQLGNLGWKKSPPVRLSGVRNSGQLGNSLWPWQEPGGTPWAWSADEWRVKMSKPRMPQSETICENQLYDAMWWGERSCYHVETCRASRTLLSLSLAMASLASSVVL